MKREERIVRAKKVYMANNVVARAVRDIPEARDAYETIRDYAASLEAENATLKADLINARELIGMTPEARWIPVSERLPEDETWVLIWEEGNGVGIAKHILHMPLWTTSDGYNIRDRNYSRVTHWMPLPSAPEVEE